MKHETNPFICPNCGSTHVEKASLIYQKSIRHGCDYATISEYAKSLGAPEKRDEGFLPSVVALLTTGLVWFFSPQVLAEYGIQTSLLSWKLLLVSMVTGWTLGLLVAMPSIRFNVEQLPLLEAEWQSILVCSRCDLRFSSNTLQQHNVGGVK